MNYEVRCDRVEHVEVPLAGKHCVLAGVPWWVGETAVDYAARLEGLEKAVRRGHEDGTIFDIPDFDVIFTDYRSRDALVEAHPRLARRVGRKPFEKVTVYELFSVSSSEIGFPRGIPYVSEIMTEGSVSIPRCYAERATRRALELRQQGPLSRLRSPFERLLRRRQSAA